MDILEVVCNLILNDIIMKIKLMFPALLLALFGSRAAGLAARPRRLPAAM